MPENEFEKKVSSEMHDLRFKPSAQVWLRVEERIKKKKKRRLFVIIFLLAGLALLGYWQRSNLFGEKKNEIVKINENDNTKTKESSNEINTVNEQSGNKNKIAGEINNTRENKNTEDDSGVSNEIPGINKNKIVKTGQPEQKKKVISQKVKQDTGKSKKNVVVLNDNYLALPDTQDQNIKTDPDTKKNNDNDTVSPDIKKIQPSIDSSLKKAEVKKVDSMAKKTDTTLKIVSVDSPVVKNPNKPGRKWKWGLHITPGISSLSEHSFSLGSQVYSDLNYSLPAGSVSGTPPARQKLADPKPGFAFQVGAFAQRQLSARTSLSLGLQYGYYSNVLRIGRRRDSLLNNVQLANTLDARANVVYNAGGDTLKYTNHYHFIELPMLFNWQLNKNKEKPFVWSTGFTIGQLISSNAIMYDTAFNGIYYKNKKQLVKTQFSLSTGFSWTVANNKRVQWNLGPVVNIHLNKLIDNPFENKKHLFFAGLRTGILFNQKK